MSSFPNPLTPELAARAIIEATDVAVPEINSFSHRVLRTRGGRIGSGMGTLLEGLWGYFINGVLDHRHDDLAQCEIAWLFDNEYNDFACIHRDQPWYPATRTGELLRIEAKSMNAGADESKAHFDELIEKLGPWDLLVVLVWRWDPIDESGLRVYPHVRDHFIGSAQSVARIRDRLHIARGGSFVDRNSCPDGCSPATCTHHGEPLNASGKRERGSGPQSCKPSSVSYAANFGGLVRMMKTRRAAARRELATARQADPVADAYARFIVRNFASSPELEETADVVPPHESRP